jgi:hypothetical protein
MKIVQGFVEIDSLISNIPTAISPIGELSQWNMTYTKDLGEYSDTAIPGYWLYSFVSVEDNAPVAIDPSTVSIILNVAKSIYEYAVSNPAPFDDSIFKANIQSSNTSITNFKFGAFIPGFQYTMPEWITFSILDTDIKIWFASESFKHQYDNFQITVIPPLFPVDLFFGTYTSVRAQLADVTMADLTDKIQQAKVIHPETVVKIFEAEYVNSVASNQRLLTNWGILIYGLAGDNVDNIKDAIIDYILANSSHNEDEWSLIFPDIFKRTEFMMLPRWDKISIPNFSNFAALYSSIQDPVECVDFAVSNVQTYAEDHIRTHTALLPYDYKAIMLVSVTGSGNVPAKDSLIKIFPDYIPVPSTSPDFSRMSIYTRNWVVGIEDALIAAETATPFTVVASNLRKTYRFGQMYISYNYDKVNYLVACRQNSYYGP